MGSSDYVSSNQENSADLVDLPQVYFVNQKKLGKGTVSARLITDDEIDLGQV